MSPGVDPLLRAPEVADMLAISVATLYRRIASGAVPPPIKLGDAPRSAARWSKLEIEQAIDTAKQKRKAN